ncbi:MAG: cobyric acid synthase [Planctomycetes bacterium]|nr:cobyric acid synthase [Planctomycetota bacterium]
MRSLAVLGTGSDVDKTVLAAALGRLSFRAGLRVAPFKAQNMANNAYVTLDGGEIGRAQALQAEACGVVPHVDHNPILLKPESDVRSQVVVHGVVAATLEARDYFAAIERFAPAVRASLDRLRASHDLVVLEGAGSAAELNLDRVDLVNWRAVEAADAAVVLVADIARGGVFAQVLGTLDLLEASRRARVVGVIVNRFRGDPTLFDEGVRLLEQRGGVPVLGVVPWLPDLDLDAEAVRGYEIHCGVSARNGGGGCLRVAIGDRRRARPTRPSRSSVASPRNSTGSPITSPLTSTSRPCSRRFPRVDFDRRAT